MSEAKKKALILPLVLAILVCSLAVPASAAEADLTIFNFTVTELTSSNAFPMGAEFRSVLYNAFFTDSAVIYACNTSRVHGLYWNEYGCLMRGVWENPKQLYNASVLGVYPLSDLTLIEETNVGGNSIDRYLYFSRNMAEKSPEFLTTALYVIAWDPVDVDGVWYGYYKPKTSSAIQDTISNIELQFYSWNVGVYWSYGKASAVQWGVVPEGGTNHGGSVIDPSTQPHISVVAPNSVQKGLFVGVRAGLVNRGDLSGELVCLLSGQNSVRTTITQVSGTPGGEYVWNVNCGSDENTDTLTLTFMHEGRPDIVSVYKLTVTDSGGGNEGSSGDLHPTEPDDEPSTPDTDIDKDELEGSGNEFSDELEDIIPDYSEDVGQALGALVTALSYDGTEAVLTIPSWTFPQIGNLIPEQVMWNEMKVDLGEYINMLPSDLLVLVQSLLTAALILYCFYELYGTVGLILMPKGGAD